MSTERGGDFFKNKDLSRKFTSPKWEVKNTYLLMPVRRLSCPPSLWRSGGLEGLPAVILAGLIPFKNQFSGSLAIDRGFIRCLCGGLILIIHYLISNEK